MSDIAEHQRKIRDSIAAKVAHRQQVDNQGRPLADQPVATIRHDAYGLFESAEHPSYDADRP